VRPIHATPPRTIHVKWPKAVAKITDDLDVLLTFYDFPAEPVRAGATFITRHSSTILTIPLGYPVGILGNEVETS
jgi:hypothetical protein